MQIFHVRSIVNFERCILRIILCRLKIMFKCACHSPNFSTKWLDFLSFVAMVSRENEMHGSVASYSHSADGYKERKRGMKKTEKVQRGISKEMVYCGWQNNKGRRGKFCMF